MFKSFTAKGFRCFSDITIKPLARVNLITGLNGVGKTSLLEAIFLHLGPGNPELPLRVGLMRGIERFPADPDEMWGWLFPYRRTTEKISLSSVDTSDVRRSLEISLVDQRVSDLPPSDDQGKEAIAPGTALSTTAIGPKELVLEYSDTKGGAAVSRAAVVGDELRYLRVPLELPLGIILTAHTRTTEQDPERFSMLERRGRQGEVLRTLRLLDPRLKRLAVLAVGGAPVIHGDIGIGDLLPLQLISEGLARLLSLVVAILNAPHGTVLVDEIENGLHHLAMVDVWKAIGAAARTARTQLFATTHSRECIEAAHRAFAATKKYDFRLHRLERIGDRIEAITYSRGSLDAAITAELEIR